MPTYIQRIDASDLTLAGGTATRDMATGTGTDTNFTVNPANGGGTQTHFFLTVSGVPNSDAWESGGTFTVEIEIDLGDSNLDCDVRIGRCDSSGTILQNGSFIGAQALTTSVSFSPVAPTWTGGEEACGNRLFIECLFTNNAVHGNHDVDVGVGTVANEVITDITEDSSGCAATDDIEFAATVQTNQPVVEPNEVVSYETSG